MTYVAIFFIATTLLFMLNTLTSDSKQAINPLDSRSPSIQASYLIILSIGAFLAIAYHDIQITADVGVIGDFFGGILNPAFSLIAIFILLKISKVQHEEFRRNTENLEQQRDTFALEKFENTLFKLIDQIEKHSHEFDVVRKKLADGTTKTTSKRTNLTNKLEKLCNEPSFTTLPRHQRLRKIKEIIKKERTITGDENAAMVRRVRLALQHIDRSNLTEDQAKFYSNLLVLSLTIRTTYLVSMYALTFRGGKDNPRKLIKKFGLARAIKPELFFIEEIKGYYQAR